MPYSLPEMVKDKINRYMYETGTRPNVLVCDFDTFQTLMKCDKFVPSHATKDLVGNTYLGLVIAVVLDTPSKELRVGRV